MYAADAARVAELRSAVLLRTTALFEVQRTAAPAVVRVGLPLLPPLIFAKAEGSASAHRV